MKPLIIVLLPALMAFAISCSKSSGTEPRQVNRNFISTEQANQMIGSYLTSVGYPQRDDEIRSWLLDAASLRQYLADTSISKVKIFLAHTKDWINAGKGGIRPGPGEFPITVIVVGVDNSSKYKTFMGEVMDNAAPCPQLCLESALEATIN